MANLKVGLLFLVLCPVMVISSPSSQVTDGEQASLDLPPPKGRYAVGSQTFVFADTSKSGPNGDDLVSGSRGRGRFANYDEN